MYKRKPDLVLKIADSFLVKAGSGVATFNIQTVPGVTAGVASDTLTAAYNDLEAVQKIVTEYFGEVHRLDLMYLLVE